MKSHSNLKSICTIKSKTGFRIKIKPNSNLKKKADFFVESGNNVGNSIAWIEKKSQLDHRTLIDVKSIYSQNPQVPLGYIAYGGLYIEADKIFSQTEFVDIVEQQAKRIITVREIAFLCIIKDVAVTNENKNQLALQFKVKAKGIYDKYAKYNVELTREKLQLTEKECHGVVASLKKLSEKYPEITTLEKWRKLCQKLQRYW